MNWCWAAVTATVDCFYRGDSLELCSVVQRTTGLTCCGPHGDPSCESQQVDIDGPLSLFGLLNESVADILPFASTDGPSVTGEIDGGRPIPVGLSIGLTGHFALITGYDANNFVVVGDPFYCTTPVPMPYETLRKGYQPGARWMTSYLTQKPPVRLAAVALNATEIKQTPRRRKSR
jgi:hypothetical protein